MRTLNTAFSIVSSSLGGRTPSRLHLMGAPQQPRLPHRTKFRRTIHTSMSSAHLPHKPPATDLFRLPHNPPANSGLNRSYHRHAVLSPGQASTTLTAGPQASPPDISTSITTHHAATSSPSLLLSLSPPKRKST
jgi:hypothetical protein